MNVSDLMFMILDPTLVVREDDDPLQSIAYFYPSTTAIDAQCAWSSQLIGLVTFWKRSLRSALRWTRIDGYILVFRELDAQILFILGWKINGDQVQSVAVSGLEEHLEFLTRVFCFYRDLHCENNDDMDHAGSFQITMESVLKLSTLRFGDLSLFRDFSAAFRGAAHVRMMGELCMEKCHSGQGLYSTRILATLVVFRADIVAKEIPEFLSQFTTILLVGTLLDDQASHLPMPAVVGFGPDNHASYVQCSRFTVHLDIEHFEMLVLDYNLRKAVRSIKSHMDLKAPDTAHKMFQECRESLKCEGAESRIKHDRVRLFFVVIRCCDCKLGLLIEEDNCTTGFETFIRFTMQQTLPLLEILNGTAMDYLMLQSERSMREMRAKILKDRKAFSFDENYGCFSELPDNEEESIVLFEAFTRFRQESRNEGDLRIRFKYETIFSEFRT